MGQGYFKPVEDRDLIVRWSTFWDSPISWGPVADYDLNEDQLYRIEKYGSTWPDMGIDRSDAEDGLVYRFQYNHMELGGYLYYSRVPELLDLLLQPESRARAMAIEKLVVEGSWS